MMKNLKSKVLVALVLSLLNVSCGGDKAQPWAMRPISKAYTFPSRNPDGTIVEEGLTVAALDLNKGREAYIHYCYACHGMNGDGLGPSSHGLRPPPRDFRLGKFKFGAVRSGEKPNDLDFVRIIKGGLHGTAMLEWDITNDELWYIIQFIKTFPKPPCSPFNADATCQAKLAQYPDSSLAENLGSPWEDTYAAGPKKGKLKPTGEPVVEQIVDGNGDLVVNPPPDPWAGKVDQAIAKGEALYHFDAECVTCHANYLTRQAIYDAKIARDKTAKVSFRDSMYFSVLQSNAVQDYGVAIMPPDFTINPLRSIRDKSEMADLYRAIASGVGVMPAWIDAAKGFGGAEALWALAHYVKSLRDLAKAENRDKRNLLRDRLTGQKPFVPPVVPEEPKPTGDAGDQGEDEGDKDKAKDAKDASKDGGGDGTGRGKGDGGGKGGGRAPATTGAAPATMAAPKAPADGAY